MAAPAELREMNDDELAHHLAEIKEDLFTLRFQLAMGKQDNSARLGHVRREVARVLTLQTERQTAAVQPGRAATAKQRPGRAAAPKQRKVAR